MRFNRPSCYFDTTWQKLALPAGFPPAYFCLEDRCLMFSATAAIQRETRSAKRGTSCAKQLPVFIPHSEFRTPRLERRKEARRRPEARSGVRGADKNLGNCPQRRFQKIWRTRRELQQAWPALNWPESFAAIVPVRKHLCKLSYESGKRGMRSAERKFHVSSSALGDQVVGSAGNAPVVASSVVLRRRVYRPQAGSLPGKLVAGVGVAPTEVELMRLA